MQVTSPKGYCTGLNNEAPRPPKKLCPPETSDIKLFKNTVVAYIIS